VTATEGFSVTGKVAPVTVKPAPVRVSLLTVTGADPVEVKVNGSFEGVPIGTSEKLRVGALMLNTDEGASPVPLRFTVRVAPEDALLVMVTVPL
jgi:hypothetical protein